MRTELSKNSKYYLPKHEYMMVKYWCLGYPDWKKELESEPDMMKGISYEGQKVQTSGGENMLEELAVRRAELAQKCRLVEETAIIVAPEIWTYLVQGVGYGLSYYELETMGIPCGKDLYYDRRRCFYYCLSKKI